MNTCLKCGAEIHDHTVCPSIQLYGSVWYMDWSVEQDTWVNVTYVLGTKPWGKDPVGHGCEAIAKVRTLMEKVYQPLRVIYGYVGTAPDSGKSYGTTIWCTLVDKEGYGGRKAMSRALV